MSSATIVIPSVFHSQLEWFLQTNADQLRDYPVIIVSSDVKTTQVLLDQYLPDVQLIKIERPCGFAKTVNLGLRAATTDWIATCNDDVELSPDWLEELLKQTQANTAGLNPVIVAPDGTIESAAISILPIGKIVTGTTQLPAGPTATQVLNAACVVYRRTALEQVGYFDQSFGSYLEDVELSLSLITAGWQLLVIPSVTIVHHRHQTADRVLGWKKSYYDMRNWWLILFKHWSWKLWLEHWPGILLERLRNLSGMIKAIIGVKG